MVTALSGALKAWDLTLCPKKSRCMVFGDDDDTPPLDIRVEGDRMEQVGEFRYLGTIISADGTCSATINDRIRKAWFRIHTSHYIWRLRGLTRKARATFFRCIVLTTLFHGSERWTPSKADMTKLCKNHHNMLAKAHNIPNWHRSRVTRAQLRHLMDDISDVDSYLKMRMLRYTGHLMRCQDEHPTLPSMAMGGQLDMEAFPYDALSASAPGPQQWGPRLARILRELLPPKPRTWHPRTPGFSLLARGCALDVLTNLLACSSNDSLCARFYDTRPENWGRRSSICHQPAHNVWRLWFPCYPLTL